MQDSSATKGITSSGKDTLLMFSRPVDASKQSLKNLHFSLVIPATPLQAARTQARTAMKFVELYQAFDSASTTLDLHLHHHRMISMSEQRSYLLRFRKERGREKKRRKKKKKFEEKKTRMDARARTAINSTIDSKAFAA